MQAGPGLGFGAGVKRARHAIEGSPCNPGDVVAGRYQVREHAGAGPLGWMFKAVEVNNEQEIALKILSPRFLQMPEEKQTFRAELQKAQKLSHPNIAGIYDSGEDSGRPFVAAQHLEGLTLRRIMDLRRQKGQRFTLQEVEPIVAQIAAALDAASGAFAHGNLKPDNVIVLPDLLKLTDFGLAVSLPRAPFMAAQKAAGVHRYLAPEFLLGEPLDARTDLFSLGVMLGEMLAGVQYEPQLSLVEKNPDLPDAVEILFRRAVSPRAAARFASAGEMAAELAELLTQARPQPKPTDDAGDVFIVEARTDPRVRIARALGEPSTTPEPPRAEPVVESREELPVKPAPLPPVAESKPRPAPVLPEPAAAVLAALPRPLAPEPFTPAPYQPSIPPPRPVFPIPVMVPIAQPMPMAAATSSAQLAELAPAVAPVLTEDLAKVAAAVGATPELLTAETVVRSAPEESEPSEPSDVSRPDRPRRGAGKRGKDKHKGRGRRSVAPPAANDPAWTTEAAVAIGPTTSALQPIPAERPQVLTPATPLKPVSRPVARTTSFVGIEDKRPNRAPVYAIGVVAALAVAFGAYSVLSSKSAPAEPQPDAAAAAAEAAPKPPEAVKPAPAKAEPTPPPKPLQTVVPSKRSSSSSLGEKIRSVQERAKKALEDRRQKKEQAAEKAKAERKAAEKEGQFEPLQITAPTPAPKPVEPPRPAAAPAAAAPAPAPAGAISGVGDGEVMVSRERKVAAVEACPPGMVRIPGGAALVGSDASDDLRNFGDRSALKVDLKPYCIDLFEFPNTAGKLPRVAASWSDADAECRNAGKRLCSEDEWEAACRGPRNLRFPYGAGFDADACNTADKTDKPRQTNLSGAFSRCKSGYGVMDMSGNAAEWTASAFDSLGPEKAVKGGHAARPGFDDRCASRRKLAPAAHDIKVGFRCCA